MRVGIEVGGTFTDLVEVRDGAVYVAKVPSTPSSPDVGAVNAVDAAGIHLANVTDLVHGSTVATNAVLERKGGTVGVIVTRGTRDIFALQRHDRQAIYDLNYVRPHPIAERRHIMEIDERLAADGTIVTPLNEETARTALAEFVGTHTFDAIAICLLHSYANPDHERRVAAFLSALAPETPITCSVDVSREFREYERASTTVLAAYVQPAIQGYLARFVDTLHTRQFTGQFSIMQSNGGRLPASAIGRNAITALFSGPAAGVVGAMGTATRSGYRDLITLDMGGTSTDVALIVDGQAEVAPQTEIDGLPVRMPVIDIVTVGAGGGSIAWVDDGGFLRAGPHSAGAEPGPASYLRGGTLPTITDAHLIRGTLQASSFLGGSMTVDRKAAVDAFQDLAARLTLPIEELADSVIRIAEGNIVRAIQQVSTERGHDPRDFTLVAFGGAGPLHAARLAEDLEIQTVLVPPIAGVLSAAGLLMSDYVHYRSRTERVRLDESAMSAVTAILHALRADAECYLRETGIDAPLIFEPILEMRYQGQAFEVSVPINSDIDRLTRDAILTAFADAHHRIFEFSKQTEDPVEIVSFRIGARARVNDLPVRGGALERIQNVPEPSDMIITEGGKALTCRLLHRTHVTSAPAAGPLLIEDDTSTIYTPPGWTARQDNTGSLILQRSA